MYTILLIIFVPLIIGQVLSDSTYDDNYIKIGSIIAIIGAILLCVQIIFFKTNKTDKVATPEKYINQTYYIDSSNHLYIDQNDTTKSFGGDVSNKIEYKGSIKSPSIEFKTVKSKDKPDDWIPFKIKYKTKTSISKISLPKSALTEKLTKVEVINNLQSDSDDLHLKIKKKVGISLADSSYFYVVEKTDREEKLDDANRLVFGKMTILNPEIGNKNYKEEYEKIVILGEFGMSAEVPCGFTESTIQEIKDRTISDEMLNDVIWAACEADELFYGENY